jgi:hypothetical protein
MHARGSKKVGWLGPSRGPLSVPEMCGTLSGSGAATDTGPRPSQCTGDVRYTERIGGRNGHRPAARSVYRRCTLSGSGAATDTGPRPAQCTGDVRYTEWVGGQFFRNLWS